MQKRLSLTISGKVQGVFFRQNTKEFADALGLKGYVKNDPTGTVTIIAQGNENSLKKLIDFGKKGTSYSQVDDIKIEWQKPQDDFKQFEIKY